MECKVEELELYLDDELTAEQTQEVERHLTTCTDCAAAVALRVRVKRGVRHGGRRFQPSAEFRKRIERQIAGRRRWWSADFKFPALASALVLALAIAGGWWSVVHRPSSALAKAEMSELIDLHVTTLASQNPVDVRSEDRHTVKPWFQGRIPFSFNLPELQGTPYSLLGGKVVYLRQSAGAQLLYGLRQHRVSVLVFQQRPDLQAESGQRSGLRTTSWESNGLRYFVVSDADGKELKPLVDLLKSANP